MGSHLRDYDITRLNCAILCIVGLIAADVRADAALMRTLDESVSSMKNADWRPICDKTLHRIKESN